MVSNNKRRKRFKRDPLIRIRLTERDLYILRCVYKRRFLNSEHIVALSGGSRQNILRRLQKLYHTGFLDRPLAQLELGRLGMNPPMVYALGNKGAELMAEELDIPAASVDWTAKNREAKSVFLEHTLMTSDFLTALEIACQQSKGIEFLDEEEIIDRRPGLLPKTTNPLSWRVSVARGEWGQDKTFTFSLIPDGAFGLRFTESGQEKEAWFFLEVDRSTMPVKRRNFYRSSFYKKMVGYLKSYQQNLYRENFDFQRPRILTIAISNERIESMINASKELHSKGRGHGYFLFTRDKAISLAKAERVLKTIWLNGRGERTSLI